MNRYLHWMNRCWCCCFCLSYFYWDCNYHDASRIMRLYSFFFVTINYMIRCQVLMKYRWKLLFNERKKGRKTDEEKGEKKLVHLFIAPNRILGIISNQRHQFHFTRLWQSCLSCSEQITINTITKSTNNPIILSLELKTEKWKKRMSSKSYLPLSLSMKFNIMLNKLAEKILLYMNKLPWMVMLNHCWMDNSTSMTEEITL